MQSLTRYLLKWDFWLKDTKKKIGQEDKKRNKQSLPVRFNSTILSYDNQIYTLRKCSHRLAIYADIEQWFCLKSVCLLDA